MNIKQYLKKEMRLVENRDKDRIKTVNRSVNSPLPLRMRMNLLKYYKWRVN